MQDDALKWVALGTQKAESFQPSSQLRRTLNEDAVSALGQFDGRGARNLVSSPREKILFHVEKLRKTNVSNEDAEFLKSTQNFAAKLNTLGSEEYKNKDLVRDFFFYWHRVDSKAALAGLENLSDTKRPLGLLGVIKEQFQREFLLKVSDSATNISPLHQRVSSQVQKDLQNTSMKIHDRSGTSSLYSENFAIASTNAKDLALWYSLDGGAPGICRNVASSLNITDPVPGLQATTASGQRLGETQLRGWGSFHKSASLILDDWARIVYRPSS